MAPAQTPDPTAIVVHGGTSTTAGVAYRALASAVVGLVLHVQSTSASPVQAMERPQLTSAGGVNANDDTAARTANSIADLRRISGLTWDQLARLFGVSRRSVHFWASGSPMKPRHEEHLRRLVQIIRRIDRGSASRNRQLLFDSGRGQTPMPFDLLAAEKYDEALAIAGSGELAPRASSTKLRSGSPDTRLPRPPAELVDTLPDDVRVEVTKGRAARSVRYRGDK